MAPGHELDELRSDVGPLDDWPKRHARHNDAEGWSRSFVLCVGRRVVGYYSLAARAPLQGSATGRIRRNMPSPVPVVLLGRLAIDRAWQGKGLGADLLRDAVSRAISAGEAIGVPAILVHAISAQAKAFYERHGFRPSPVDPMMLMITLGDAQGMLVAGQ